MYFVFLLFSVFSFEVNSGFFFHNRVATLIQWCGNVKKQVWERSWWQDIAGNYTIMLGCYARDNLQFITLCDVWSWTQKIWVKHTFSSQLIKKVRECRPHAFSPHYTPGRLVVITLIVILLTCRCSVLERPFWFEKILAGSGPSAYW